MRKRRPRRKLTASEAARALAGGVHDPGDLLWAALVREIEEEEEAERQLDELVRRVMRWHTMGTLGDPD